MQTKLTAYKIQSQQNNSSSILYYLVKENGILACGEQGEGGHRVATRADRPILILCIVVAPGFALVRQNIVMRFVGNDHVDTIHNYCLTPTEIR